MAYPWQNLTEPMQITSLFQNNGIASIGKIFLDKMIMSGIEFWFINDYYNSNTPITLRIYQGTTYQTHECIGLSQYKLKLTELKVCQFKYSDLTFTSLLLGTDSNLVNIHGKIHINTVPYNFITSIIFRNENSGLKIIGQILEIFT